MADTTGRKRSKATSGSKSTANSRSGGDAARQAQKWGGGAKGSKGPVTKADKRNPNSSAKT